MHDSLSMRGSDARANWLHQFERAHGRHRAFFSHDVLQRFPLHELHDEKRHRAAHDSEVSYGNNVLMTNCRGRESFLAKTRDEIQIVTDEIGKDDLDRVRGFQKDMTRFVNDAHAALAQPFLELITAVEDRLAADGRRHLDSMVGTVVDVVRETTATGWTLFHSMVLLTTCRLRASQGIPEDFSGCCASKATQD